MHYYNNMHTIISVTLFCLFVLLISVAVFLFLFSWQSRVLLTISSMVENDKLDTWSSKIIRSQRVINRFQFQIFALSISFLHCLGLIDMLSANQNAEINVCILLYSKQVISIWASSNRLGLELLIQPPLRPHWLDRHKHVLTSKASCINPSLLSIQHQAPIVWFQHAMGKELGIRTGNLAV